jgi:hypothetical protein
MARECIFCGSDAGSNEHLFPDWLNELFPVKKGDPDVELARHIANESGVERTTWGAREIASATTKQVCHNCNTGWMARLEGMARPLLTPLTQGHAGDLNAEQQIVIATWAVKTAMVCEATLSEMADNFTDDERSLLREQCRPPASVAVVIAAVEGQIAPMHYSAAKARMLVGTAEAARFHVHTIQVGPLVLQVVRRVPPLPNFGTLESSSLPSEIEADWEVATTIFPPKAKCVWPPPRVLDWDGLMRLSKRGVEIPPEWELPSPGAPCER